jgi:hypothetical protein
MKSTAKRVIELQPPMNADKRRSKGRFDCICVHLRSSVALISILLGLLLAGCRQDMHDQPRYDPLEAARFFADGRSARLPVEGTVARGQLKMDEHLYQGRRNGQPVTEMPYPVTRAMLDRGRERFNIYCSPCHSPSGDGEGMIVQRGLKHPPSFHIDRLREAPVGHFFDVITNGFGAMYSYASRVPVDDRWAIVAYIRVLQLSQRAPVAAVPADKRSSLKETKE